METHLPGEAILSGKLPSEPRSVFSPPPNYRDGFTADWSTPERRRPLVLPLLLLPLAVISPTFVAGCGEVTDKDKVVRGGAAFVASERALPAGR